MDVGREKLCTLLRLAVNTAEHEITCEESGERVHRYIEFRLAPTGELPEDLKLVEQHLKICPGCEELVNAILQSMRDQTHEGNA
jgi:hypothetical protein